MFQFCTSIKDPGTGNDWILVAGGATPNNVYSDPRILYYDVTLNNGVWNTMASPLPNIIGSPATGPSILKFTETEIAIYQYASVDAQNNPSWPLDEALIYSTKTHTWTRETMPFLRTKERVKITT